MNDVPADVFSLLEEARVRRLRAAADEWLLIARACDAHHVDEEAASLGAERLVAGGAPGTPLVGEFLAHELAVVLHVSPTSAALRITEVLNVRHRHPRMWAAVQALALEPWQATKAAAACAAAGLDAAAADSVDRQLTAAAALVPWPRALTFLAGLIVKADPALAGQRADQATHEHKVVLSEVHEGSATVWARLAARDGLFLDGMVERIADVLADQGDHRSRQQRRATALGMLATPGFATQFLADAARRQQHTQDALEFAGDGGTVEAAAAHRPSVLDLAGIDADRLLPKTTLHVHVYEGSVVTGQGVARSEQAGALSVDMLRAFLGNTRVRVLPVLDRDHLPAVDAYEVPERLREELVQRHLVEAFPWSNRKARGCEADHTVPYDPAAPPGARQTRADNLGPAGKRTHRVKTHGDWKVTQLVDGVFHWRSPHGYHTLVTPSGTIPLGRERPGAAADPRVRHGPRPSTPAA